FEGAWQLGKCMDGDDERAIDNVSVFDLATALRTLKNRFRDRCDASLAEIEEARRAILTESRSANTSEGNSPAAEQQAGRPAGLMIPRDAQKQQGPTRRPDGPDPPLWFWWKGRRHRIGKKRSRLSWLLLDYFWNRDSSTYEDLQGPGLPWSDPVSDTAVS